jgi:hypothetical protein
MSTGRTVSVFPDEILKQESPMNRLKVLAVAAIVTAGTAVPALADYVRLGSVDVGYRVDRDSSFVRFAGGMEGLRLTADRSNIFCRHITVTYGDGRRDEVYSGLLREDRPVNVDLAGGTRRVSRIDFVCRSDEFSGGRIHINGDLGRFRDEWRRDPYWAGIWSTLFGRDDGRGYGSDRFDNDWVAIGRERFEGRRDHESTLTGWRGRSVDRIGLRPIDGDARCRRVTVQFGNGSTRDLNGADYLQRGRVTVLDLPGADRNVVKINLACRAVGDYAVSIEVLARK